MLFEYMLVIWILLSGTLIILLICDSVLEDEDRYVTRAAKTLSDSGRKMLEARPKTLSGVITAFTVVWVLSLLASLGVWALRGISL